MRKEYIIREVHILLRFAKIALGSFAVLFLLINIVMARDFRLQAKQKASGSAEIGPEIVLVKTLG